MIMRGTSHEMSNKIFGHHVVHNVTKFQSCRHDNRFFIGQKPFQKHFDENNTL